MTVVTDCPSGTVASGAGYNVDGGLVLLRSEPANDPNAAEVNLAEWDLTVANPTGEPLTARSWIVCST